MTPDNLNGLCQPVRTCTVLVELLQTQRKNPEVINFLRRSHCGYAGRDPLVCCPSSSSAPKTTQKPTSDPTIARGGSLPRAPACGIDAPDRIFNGEPTKIDEFPWLAQIQYKKREWPNINFDHN